MKFSSLVRALATSAQRTACRLLIMREENRADAQGVFAEPRRSCSGEKDAFNNPLPTWATSEIPP